MENIQRAGKILREKYAEIGLRRAVDFSFKAGVAIGAVSGILIASAVYRTAGRIAKHAERAERRRERAESLFHLLRRERPEDAAPEEEEEPLEVEITIERTRDAEGEPDAAENSDTVPEEPDAAPEEKPEEADAVTEEKPEDVPEETEVVPEEGPDGADSPAKESDKAENPSAEPEKKPEAAGENEA